MWSLHPTHTYLNLSVKEVPPRLLNRMVDLAMGRMSSCYDLEPPLNRLQSSTPTVFAPHVDLTRAKEAFGRWALPKLRRELHSDDPLLVRQAIYTIADLVHNPEKCFEAIRLGVIARIQDLLMNFDPVVRDRCAIITATIAGQAEGREAIMASPVAIHNLAKLTADTRAHVRHKVALAIEMLARAWTGADFLIDHGFVPLLFKRIIGEKDKVVVVHMATLAHMLHRERVEALQLGAMYMCEYMMEQTGAKVCASAMGLLAQLASHPYGALQAVELDLLPLLQQKLNDQSPEVQTNAAAAIMFITVTTPSRIRAWELGMLDRLLDLMEDWDHPELQINVVKALTNLCEHPSARAVVVERHQDRILGIDHQDLVPLKRHIRTLMKVVRWKP